MWKTARRVFLACFKVLGIIFGKVMAIPAGSGSDQIEKFGGLGEYTAEV
jgi:hypothetical protein